MKPKDINIGLATRSEITELKRKDLVTDAKVAKFSSDDVMFVKSIVVKFFDESPLTKMSEILQFLIQRLW